MTGILSIANITFKEGIRNRALFGIFIMALLAFAITIVLTDMFMRDITRVAASLSLSTISFAGLLMVVFIGTNLLAQDIDRRTIYMVLSRPISRAEYVAGKFLGIAQLVLGSVTFLGILSSIPVLIAGIAYENPQSLFSWGIYFTAILFIALKLIVISAIIVFLSSVTSTSFLTLIFTISIYIIGSSTETVKGLVDVEMKGVHITPSMAMIIKSIYYIFPNLAAFDLKIQAIHGIAVSSDYLAWIVLYGFIYTAIMVASASLLMERREFP